MTVSDGALPGAQGERRRGPAARMGHVRRHRAGIGKTDDATLADMARRGSDAAWEEIVARFSGLVASVARAHRLSYADGADVAQHTWMQLHRHLPQLRQPERLGAWIARTARNESLRIASRRREAPVDLASVDVATRRTDDPLHGVLADERTQVVRKAIDRIPARNREMLRLLVWEEMSYVDVSGELRIPVGSIGPTRDRALRRLARLPEIVDLRDGRGGADQRTA
jgi:RNA polymerase sigma factor (sigma-70 family)